MSEELVPVARIQSLSLLIDINIVLDVLLEREEFAEEAAILLSAVEFGRAQGFIASHTLTTAYYIVTKAKDRNYAKISLSSLLRFLKVVPIETADFQQAFILPINDYEDAVQAAAGLKMGVDYLVTRDLQGYRGIQDLLEVRSPAEVLALVY